MVREPTLGPTIKLQWIDCVCCSHTFSRTPLGTFMLVGRSNNLSVFINGVQWCGAWRTTYDDAKLELKQKLQNWLRLRQYSILST